MLIEKNLAGVNPEIATTDAGRKNPSLCYKKNSSTRP